MWWQDKLVRNLRCRLAQKPGIFGALLSAIGKEKAYVGEVKIVHMGTNYMIRDITIFVDDQAHLQRVLKAIQFCDEAELLEVRDEVLEMHQGGKIAVRSRYEINNISVLRKVYTPGVAEVSLLIKNNPALARRYTAIRHLVGIVTDGSAVLGLGDVGPLAAMPVMEGKASLMETFTGLSGMPILLNTKDPDQIVEAVVSIAPTFSAIQLEDISAPRCFYIEEKIQDKLSIPVMHDDQHGTACVVTAALMNISRQTGCDLARCNIGVIGLGAAGLAISKMLMFYLNKPVFGTDINSEANQRLKEAGGQISEFKEILASCKVVISTTGVPGLIKKEMIRKGQIILALSNPNPEIEPEVATEAGAAFAADGRVINNVLGFPGIFRGAVDANVPRITREMLLAASQAIAGYAPAGDIVPNALDKQLHRNVAKAVARVALEQKLNRDDLTGYFD